MGLHLGALILAGATLFVILSTPAPRPSPVRQFLQPPPFPNDVLVPEVRPHPQPQNTMGERMKSILIEMGVAEEALPEMESWDDPHYGYGKIWRLWRRGDFEIKIQDATGLLLEIALPRLVQKDRSDEEIRAIREGAPAPIPGVHAEQLARLFLEKWYPGFRDKIFHLNGLRLDTRDGGLVHRFTLDEAVAPDTRQYANEIRMDVDAFTGAVIAFDATHVTGEAEVTLSPEEAYGEACRVLEFMTMDEPLAYEKTYLKIADVQGKPRARWCVRFISKKGYTVVHIGAVTGAAIWIETGN